MTAAAWRSELEAWALPDRLLDAVDESPYGWPAELWQRMRRLEPPSSPTRDRVAALAGPEGSVLDVGAGTGRIGLPLAADGHAVTFVERSETMLEGLTADAEDLGITPTVVRGSWPDVADAVEPHTVTVSANVVYDVQDIAPFLEALHAAAERAVVIEATPVHPWSYLAPYYRALHDLDRPAGPTVELLVEIIESGLEVAVAEERWVQPRSLRFADLQELLEFVGRRLVMPRERWSDLMDVIVPDVTEVEGWVVLGAPVVPMVTLSWPTGDR